MCRKESKCSNKNCRFLHPQPKDRKRSNRESKEKDEVPVVGRDDSASTTPPVVPMPSSDIRNKKPPPSDNVGFQENPVPQDSSQDMKKILEELTKNVQILMQDRAMLRSWGWLDTTQYYPQQS